MSLEEVFEQLTTVFAEVRDFKNAQAKTEKSMIVDSQMPLYKSGVISIMKLRQLNRHSNLNCKERREKTHERKCEVDELHLQLQNLRYEVMHLQKEITNCLEFKSKHEDIELQDVDEFLLTCSAADQKKLPSADPHRLMLNRLEHELKERKRLASTRKELGSSIKQKKDSQHQLEKKLQSLRPSLEALKVSVTPLQEFFSPSLIWEREQYQLAYSLPLPLYVLYVQALGFGKSEDENISFSILGDSNEVQSFNQHLIEVSNNFDNGEEADEDVSVSKKKKRKSISAQVDTEPVFCKAFPLSVSLTISKEGSSVVILFNHLSFFNVTCASIPNIVLDKSCQNEKNFFCDKNSFLHCLYEGDSGRTSPNAFVSSQIRKLGGDNFSAAVRKYGFPYKWVQRVCGIQAPSDVLEESKLVPNSDVAADNVREFVGIVRERLHTQLCLAKQIAVLDKLKLFDGNRTGGTQFVRWSQMTSQELQKLTNAGGNTIMLKSNLQERVNRHFLATFQNGEARLHAVVCVTPNYPLLSPVVSIMVELSEKQREPYDAQQKSIEAEVNISCVKEYGANDDLLLVQLRRLVACFELYLSHKMPHVNKYPVNIIRGKARLIALSE